MNLLASFVWLRWRLLLNGLRGGRRHDILDRLSRVASLLAPIVLVAFFGLAAVGLSVAGFVAGGLLAGPDPHAARAVLAVVRLLLLVVTAVLILVPLGRSMQGGFPGTERLLLLPIPRSWMHFVDVAAGLLDPWLVFLIPPLAALTFGILAAGRAVAAALALAAGAALLMVLVSLSALAALLLNWLLRERRRAEVATLIFAVALTLGSMIPAFLVEAPRDDSKLRVSLPASAWIRPLPGELFAWTLRAAVQDRAGAALAGVAGLLLEAAVLYACSSRVHAILLTTTAASGHRGRGLAGLRETRALPGLGHAAAAVARAQASTALRTLRGRMAVFLNAPVVMMFGFMMHRLESLFGATSPIGFTADGPSLFGMGAMFSLLSLHPILMNQFGTDRAGLTLQFLSPVTERDLLIGKACGGVWLAAMSSGLCLAAAWLSTPRAPLLLWLCAVAAGAATVLLCTPISALFSIVFPRQADLTRMGSGGNAHPAAALAGTLLMFVAALPGSLILLAGSFLDVPALAAAASFVWLAVSAGAAWGILCLMAPVLRERRENLLLAASGA